MPCSYVIIVLQKTESILKQKDHTCIHINHRIAMIVKVTLSLEYHNYYTHNNRNSKNYKAHCCNFAYYY